MNATKSRFETLAVTALVVLAVGASVAAAGPLSKDEIYRSVRLESHPEMTVAILPVVTVVENAPIERVVEQAWYSLYQGTRTTWVPADEVRARLAKVCGEDGPMAKAAHDQVWREGAVDATTARCLAKVLDVDAVLTVRVDRFGIEDGCRAVVGMTAVLMGGDGTRLWSIEGAAARGTTKSSRETNFNDDLSWVRDPRLEPCSIGGCLGRAMFDLFARWAYSLPNPMYSDGEVEPMLASGEPSQGPAEEESR
jgi:hypothetical protein